MQQQAAWHLGPVEDVLRTLGADAEKGLDPQEARRRLRHHGRNELPQPKATPWPVLLARQFGDFMVIVLLAATAVSAALGETGDAVTIFGIVLVNALLGLLQEYRAEQSLAALTELAAPTARVRRAGEELRIPAAEVTVGDILVLEAGDRVAADARLLRSVELWVEESALTGEAHPVRKDAAAHPEPDAPLAERANSVYQGSLVVRGRGEAVVCAVGMQTQVGQVAGMIHAYRPEPTPLERRLNQLGQVLVWVCLLVSGAVTAVGVLRGEDPMRMFLTGVSLGVAAIPEGLPAIVTVALAVGVQRMARRHAVIRRLPAVETLGCATVICTDNAEHGV